MKEIQTRLGLYINHASTHEYFTITASIVTIGRTKWERDYVAEGHNDGSYDRITSETVRSSSSDDTVNGLYIADFQIKAQGNSTDEPRGPLYGYSLRYRDVYAVELRKAEQMAATLRLINKRIDAIDAKYGRPASFAQYLGRVAAAIKADAFVYRQAETRYGYNKNDDRIVSITDGMYYIDRLEREWQTERERQAREAAEARRQVEAEAEATAQ